MKVIRRSEWGARPAKRVTLLVHPVAEVDIHHTADMGPITAAAAKGYMADLQWFFLRPGGRNGEEDWSDIAYSFVVDRWAQIFEGRGFDRADGATGTADGGNRSGKSISICFAGYYHPPHNMEPSVAQLDAARWLIAQAKAKGKITQDAAIHPHRFWKPTACPGETVMAKMTYLRKPWKPPKKFKITRPSGKVVYLGLKKTRALADKIIGGMKKAKELVIRRIK